MDSTIFDKYSVRVVINQFSITPLIVNIFSEDEKIEFFWKETYPAYSFYFSGKVYTPCHVGFNRVKNYHRYHEISKWMNVYQQKDKETCEKTINQVISAEIIHNCLDEILLQII